MESEPNYCTSVRERLSSMLKANRRTDCRFIVGKELQEEVEGHKILMAEASPVFNAMFFGEMAESQTPIPIPDIHPATFKAMLEYIYTDDTKLTALDDAINVYYAAKKYILPNLGDLCTTYIIGSTLTKEIVFRVYEFALMFEEKNLVDKCLSFITDNMLNILNSKSLEDAQLSTLVVIFSLPKCMETNALDFFKAVERYVETHEKRMESGNISEVDMVEVNGEHHAEDSKETSEKSLQKDKSVPSPRESKEKLDIRPLLEKIHFLTLGPQTFAEGPAKSDLLTEAEVLAILMNILSCQSHIPLPSGFSTYRRKKEFGICENYCRFCGKLNSRNNNSYYFQCRLTC